MTSMEAVLNSFFLVAASEMGDKTQLLALILAARFKKPLPILSGIFVATILNHGLASWVGVWASGLLSSHLLSYALAALFFGFAIWILFPDKDEGLKSEGSASAFVVTLVAFFLAEMGDKTQLATVALAASFRDVLAVTAGTTLGMMFSDGLAVLLGDRFLRRVPMLWVRRGASVLFAIFGLVILLRG